MIIPRSLVVLALLCSSAALAEQPAGSVVCSRQGTDVTCNDGRRGILAGEAIVWPDGTRSSRASPHPSVRYGKGVHIGPGVFAEGKPVDDPNSPNKTRCAILDGLPYCY
jgi:hypothetical protein